VVTGTITGIYDKGSGAVIATEAKPSTRPPRPDLHDAHVGVYPRRGRFGGDRGPSGRVEQPAGAPTTRHLRHTSDQALLYACRRPQPAALGPQVRASAGSTNPSCTAVQLRLHGAALLHTLCESDPDRFVSMAARFSKPVFRPDPHVNIWETGDGTAYFQTLNEAGDVVIDAGQGVYKL